MIVCACGFWPLAFAFMSVAFAAMCFAYMKARR
jgi:hypothetical protein